MKAVQTLLGGLRRLPPAWKLAALLVAAAVLVAAALTAREVRGALAQRTRHGEIWGSENPWHVDLRAVFAVLDERTGIGGDGRRGLRLFVRSDHLNWFALEQGDDGAGRAVFFALEDPTGQRAPAAIGPRVLRYSPAETRAFLARFDGRLKDYWGFDSPPPPAHGTRPPWLTWQRRDARAGFGGEGLAVPGHTYRRVSDEVRSFLALRLGPGEVPDAAWDWPRR